MILDALRSESELQLKAHQELKSLLHISPMGCIARPGQLQDYRLRKLAEGKTKMTVLNSIRNKIIQRICSVVHRVTPYIVNYPLHLL